MARAQSVRGNPARQLPRSTRQHRERPHVWQCVLGQKQGRLIVNNRVIASTVNLVSSGNHFYDDAGGTIIVGGLSSNNTRADGNRRTAIATGRQAAPVDFNADVLMSHFSGRGLRWTGKTFSGRIARTLSAWPPT